MQNYSVQLTPLSTKDVHISPLWGPSATQDIYICPQTNEISKTLVIKKGTLVVEKGCWLLALVGEGLKINSLS